MKIGMNKINLGQESVRAHKSKATILRLIAYMSTSKGVMAIVSVIVVITAILSVLGPYIMGKAIDNHIAIKSLKGFGIPISILLVVYVSHAFLSWVSGYLVVKVSQVTVKGVRKDLFEKLQLLPVKFFDGHNDGDLVSRLSNDVDNISNTLNQSLVQLISSVVTLVAVLIMMVVIDIRLTMVSVVAVPIVVLITKVIAKYTKKFYKEKSKDLGHLNAYVEEAISGQKVIFSYGVENETVEDFDKKNEAYKASAIRAETLSSIMGPIMNFMNNLIYAVIAFLGAYMVVKNMTSVGVVVIFISYSRQFSRPINQIASLYNTIQSAIAGAERVFEIIDMEEEVETGARVNIRGDVEIKSLHFSYENGQKVLEDINMTAKKGDMIAIVGPTGAGKTTVINLLTRFYDQYEGTIKIDQKNILDIQINHLRSQLGIVLQDTYLFEGTVLENIRYGKPSASDDEIIAAAKMSNAHNFIHRLPEAYKTKLSGEGFGISQGQRQLIAIARAILADPKILILDEATSSIDTRTEKHIQEGLQNLMKGRTSFVIAHRLSTIKAADAIHVIDKGSIVESGSHDELIELRGYYNDMYTTQFNVS